MRNDKNYIFDIAVAQTSQLFDEVTLFADGPCEEIEKIIRISETGIF